MKVSRVGRKPLDGLSSGPMGLGTMPYPTSTLYAYRVREVDLGRIPSEGYFVAEFTGNGTTWLPVFAWTFQNETEAMNEIANIVSAEAQFKAKVLAGETPIVRLHAYPPA